MAGQGEEKNEARELADGAVRPGPNVVSFEVGRLKRAMPAIVARCMSFSAMPSFDSHLIAAVKDFYGLEMDVATAEAEILEHEEERIRFFPWFLWDWRLKSGAPTVGERFLQDVSLASFERWIVEGLCRSYVSFYEALDDATAEGALLRDLATGQTIRVDDGRRRC